ncbi:putative zinc-binding peptidase [Flammeovirgaceae bacterium SG7u.111]|nr:putative zinc-binding peptidase [Flammeovirgaceae bacterium SG7u.132]WPO37404.1 putative zinc-binding peptidase [Flammeovirgaceae bacterium SG7u.111]
MKIYSCQNCGNSLYFENTSCLKCKYSVGFMPEEFSLLTLRPFDQNGVFSKVKNHRKKYKYCENHQHGVCNWLIPAHQDKPYCRACELNNIVPPLNDDEVKTKWEGIEKAKHRLAYSLLKLNLPLYPKDEDSEVDNGGLAFDFLSPKYTEKPVMTGHANGLITINIVEANEAEMVKNKVEMGEKYRTLLGHFRHEVGHYYWEVLIRDNPKNLAKFRLLFGDERESYQEALKVYYSIVTPKTWTEEYISKYATAHPWEDWAETWAHYLHIMDTLETASYFNIAIKPKGVKRLLMSTSSIPDPYKIKDFQKIVDMWFPLSFAVNSLNRSMGYQDFYPFVFSNKIIEKLSFIHEVTHQPRVLRHLSGA